MSADAALAAIADAFGAVERPANDELLHEQCFDDGDLLELYGIADWRDMTDEQVIRNYAAPSFLSHFERTNTPAQRDATRLFLEAMSEHHDTAAALEYWAAEG